MKRNGGKRLKHERELVAIGVSNCRGCLQIKDLSQFPPNAAVCLVCRRAKQMAYKARTRIIFLRERRVSMLIKYLRAACVDGECPLCGTTEHLPGCSVQALMIDLEMHGFVREATA